MIKIKIIMITIMRYKILILIKIMKIKKNIKKIFQIKKVL